MRRALAAFAILAASSPALLAQPADGGRAAANRIVAVTVYQTNALVTRTVDVPEGAGTLEVVVSPLPAETVPSSLYAEGTNGLRVLNTRFRSRAVREDTREEVRKIQAQLKQLAQETQRLQSDIQTAQLNLQFLAKLEGFTGATMQHLTEKGLLNSESTIALAKYVMTTRGERTKEIVALQQQVQATQEQSEFAKRQLAELTSGVQRTERDAVIVVDKANAAAGTVRLNYLVSAVTWRPQYKLKRGVKDAEAVALEYLASVRQQTGEDWRGVTLTLSTAQPMLNAAPPDLRSLEVSAIPAGAPNPMAGILGQAAQGDGGEGRGKQAVKDIQQRVNAGRAQAQVLSNTLNWMEAGKVVNDAAAMEQFCDLLASRDEIAQARRELGDASEGPSVTYQLRTKLTLPSRADEQTLEVARIEVTPEYFYKAVPVLTPHVYRQATLTNKSDFVLLPGEATMYIGTDFVGRAELPLVAIGKQFTVGFGVDPQLQTSRQLVHKTRTTTGGNQVLSFDYRILINSYKTEAVRVQVWDRMPKAEAQAVAVSLTGYKPDLSGDALYVREDRPKNLLRWDVTVQPTQHGERALPIDYQFKLELDKQMQIGAVAAK